MNTEVHNLFLQQGDYFKEQVRLFLSLGIDNVLDYAFTNDKVFQYVENKRLQLIDEILQLFKNKKKYKFQYTGEDFELTEDFFEYTLLFYGNLAKFKRYLQKCSNSELFEYYRILFKDDLLSEKF